MTDSTDHRFDLVKKFLDILLEDNSSLESIKRGFYDISSDLNLGRVIGEIPQSSNDNELRLLAENRVLFISDFGFDAKGSFDVEFSTNSGAPGTMNVAPVPSHQFTDAEKETITAIIRIADIQISRFFAINEVIESSMRQKLTGLPNSDGYFRKVREKFSNSSIYNYDSYYFDLKGFGLVNKRYGQKEANKIMFNYARKLNSFFNRDEVLGHLGGDNFVALVTAGERSKEFQNMLLQGVDVEGENSDGEKGLIRITAVVGYTHIIPPITINRIVSDPAMALTNAKRNKKAIVELTEDISYQAIRAKVIEQSFEKELYNVMLGLMMLYERSCLDKQAVASWLNIAMSGDLRFSEKNNLGILKDKASWVQTIVEQAVGRLCRTKNKPKTTYILYDETMSPFFEYAQTEKSLTQEYKKLHKYIIIQTVSNQNKISVDETIRKNDAEYAQNQLSRIRSTALRYSIHNYDNAEFDEDIDANEI